MFSRRVRCVRRPGRKPPPHLYAAVALPTLGMNIICVAVGAVGTRPPSRSNTHVRRRRVLGILQRVCAHPEHSLWNELALSARYRDPLYDTARRGTHNGTRALTSRRGTVRSPRRRTVNAILRCVTCSPFSWGLGIVDKDRRIAFVNFVDLPAARLLATEQTLIPYVPHGISIWTVNQIMIPLSTRTIEHSRAIAVWCRACWRAQVDAGVGAKRWVPFEPLRVGQDQTGTRRSS